MKNCESRELGYRAIEDKKRTFKLFKEYKLVSFEDFSTNKIDKLWEALKDRYKDDSSGERAKIELKKIRIYIYI